MSRITHRDFSRGWYVSGSRDNIPSGTLYQTTGIRTMLTGEARSRWGGAKLATLTGPAISLYRFFRADVVQVETDLKFVDVTAQADVSLFRGAERLGGGPLSFASMIPSPDTDTRLTADGGVFEAGPEHLYVAGGGLDEEGKPSRTFPGIFKINTNGRLSKWGIDPPQGLSVRKENSLVNAKVIDDFEGGSISRWFDEDGNATGGGSLENPQSGTVAMRIQTSGADTTKTLSKAVQDFDGDRPDGNLRFLGGPNNVESSDQDWIIIWIFTPDPARIDSFDIAFDVTPGAVSGAANIGDPVVGWKDFYAYRVLVEEQSPSGPAQSIFDDPEIRRLIGTTTRGSGRNFGFIQVTRDNVCELFPNRCAEAEKRVLFPAGTSESITDALIEDLATTKISSTLNTWTLVRIPKSSFSKSGKTQIPVEEGGRDWQHVRRVRFELISNSEGIAEVVVDRLALHIGVGMMGNYKYAITFKNKATGVRSLPSNIVEVKGVKRDHVSLSGSVLGTAGTDDDQVDTVEVWRTVGGGNVLFKSDEFNYPRNTPVLNKYTDIVADFPGMQDEVTTSFDDEETSAPRKTIYLQPEALPFDNVRPPETMSDVVGPHFAQLFFLDAAIGQRGRVFFTAIGRPESIAGFLEVGGDDRRLQKLAIYNGNVYVFSEKGLDEIRDVSGGQLYASVPVYGVPGTVHPYSVVPTPYGIVYLAKDGVRLFTAAGSQLVNPNPIMLLFRGEIATVPGTDGNIAKFPSDPTLTGRQSKVRAAYVREEYHISDGVNFLAVNLRTGAWRHIGTFAVGAMYAEDDTDVLQVAIGNTFFDWEKPDQLTDGGVGIPFAFECPGTVVEDQSAFTKMVQRIYIDADTHGQTLTSELHMRGDKGGVAKALPDLTTTGRQLKEFGLDEPTDILSLELSHTGLLDEVEIYGVYFDVHLPEQGGAKT